MLSLFSMNPTEAGFRLHAAEVLNWGTFDTHIYQIQPQGENSLLTGANGSGKTTYIDALLTLLVPEKRMRFYNQSAGTTNRNERTEESYVLGEYGETEQDQGREVQRLRPKSSPFFSVLLASFFNQGTQQWLTLFQVRWFGSGSELKRCFGLAHTEMHIATHFSNLESDGHWKKTLRQQVSEESNQDKGVQFFDLPGEYGRALREQLGMRSEKSQTLFSQTIGLKVLGDLNLFIRSHMLEKAPAEAEFQKLRESYYELRSAYKALKKLRHQLNLLEPIEQFHDQWQSQNAELQQMQEKLDKLPLYQADQLLSLIAKELTQKQQTLNTQQSVLQQIEAQQEALKESIFSLEISIRNDETGRRIKDLEQAIKAKSKEKESREKHLRNYHRFTQILGLPNISDRASFEANQRQITTLEEAFSDQYKTAKDQHITYRVEEEQQQKLLIEQARTLQELRLRKNNIHGDEARIRAKLIEHLGVSEAIVPFVGELLQVKSSEQPWEMAIEKVLHNFALHLLVPESLIAKVNAWVHSTRLNGRIRYFKIPTQSPAHFQRQDASEEFLPSKLEIHPETAYKNWLLSRLQERFAYLCTDDLALFERSAFALTSQGLIRDREKHHKDDRSHTFKRQNYVLGWENTTKIQDLEHICLTIENQLATLKQQVAQADHQEKQWQKKLEYVKRLQEETFHQFEDLDHLSLTTELTGLTQEKAQLEKASDRIRLLENQLTEHTQKQTKLDAHRDRVLREDERLRADIRSLQAEHTENQLVVEDHGPEDRQAVRLLFHETLPFTPAQERLDFKKQMQTWQGTLNTAKHQTERSVNQIENKLAMAMLSYKTPSAEVLQQFEDWSADTYQLGNGIAYIEDYLTLAREIRAKELIEQEKRFKQYFNHSIIEHMTSFEQFMEREREHIQDNIKALNQALRSIDFRSNPQTYIQIKASPARTGNTMDFREQLRSWRPIASESHTTEALESSFEKIQALINKLEERPDRRKEVIDVRNWMTFSAQEFYGADQEIARTYETTGKLSGGEKAQLTYTILAAALAYQFNISQVGNDVKSFRFICVDESFSNQDDEKAAYLMNLCKQLHLQLLVVTPNDKTHVVEPYISRVHLVLRRNNKNSVLYDMPITEYQEQLNEVASINAL